MPRTTAPRGGPGESAETVPVTALRGVGPRLEGRLAQLGIHTLQDLLFHLPYRYQDRTRVVPIGALRPGDEALIRGQVGATQVRQGRRRSLLCHISDGSGFLLLRFFHFSRAQHDALTQGAAVRCFGEVRRGPNSLEMVHPEYRLLEDPEAPVTAEAALTPIYPATEGLTQNTLRRLTDEALTRLRAQPPADLLPADLTRELDFPGLLEALELLHRPPPDVSRETLTQGHHPARRRLAFEELLGHHLSMRALRRHLERKPAPALAGDGALTGPFLGDLPFTLTQAQTRVWGEVSAELAGTRAMHRLLQGDVGSGKTVVAALALLQTIEAGYQGAFMAPTELLAEQHLNTLTQWLAPLGHAPAWLSGRAGPRQREAVGAALERGEQRLAVGTHALFQDEVRFQRLGLVVVDEQHRFGVHQRLALRQKGETEHHIPHQLIMTATPIPRTLAMTAYADLDVSVIDALPPGRTPVETAAVPDTRREEVVERIRHACAGGRQAYWVCTLIEESETLEAEAAAATAARLAEQLPELRVGLVHGRLAAADKQAAMHAFKEGETHLLVATTVIEVGVDVPRASLMIIENPERLGLAQLHQLRGRVGRGSERSTCVLLYHPPLSGPARERLGVMRETSDGFVIAQKDLEMRGPGEMLGTRQTGLLQFRVADLQRDHDLLGRVDGAARKLLREHPERARSLVRRWVGDGVDYAHV